MELSGTSRNLPPEPTPAHTGTLRNLAEPATFRSLLAEPTPAHSGTFRNPPPEPTPAHTGILRNNQHTPELSGTFRNLPPEPTPGHTGTLRNLPEPASGTCSCDPRPHTPELIWAEGPFSLRCWGKRKNLTQNWPPYGTTSFPECVARVPVSLWGSGNKAVFAECCVCARNRPQPFASVRNRLRVRLSTMASAPGRCLESSSIGICRGGVCLSDLWRRSYTGVCRGGVSVSDLCRRSYTSVCRGGVSVSDLCGRSYIDVCRGGVSVSDLWRRSYFAVCKSQCPTRVSSESASQECQVRASYKSVLQECQIRSVK